MEAMLARLTEAIDAAVTVDPDHADNSDLDATLIEMIRQRHRLDAAITRIAHRWDRRMLWTLDGSRSPAARLARDANTSPRTARSIIRRARTLPDTPHVQDAWAHGQISAAQVDMLTNARTGREQIFERDEALLVEQCTMLRYAQATAAVDYWKQRADAECGRDQPAPPDTECRISNAGDAVYGTFTLDPVGGATVQAAIDRIAEELRRDDLRNGVARSMRARRADALVEMAIRSHTTPRTGRRPEPLVMILAGERSFEHICELATGQIITPHAIATHLDHALIQTIVFDGADRPITASPARTFRGILRRAIQVRDRHCQHPSGCDAPITHCDVDHIIEHRNGGATDHNNGRLQCTTHNRHSDLHNRSPRPPPAA